MFEDLKIVYWPDPRLKKVSKPVEKFDETLRALVQRMFELMRANRGVGLAAPQVGQNLRLFVMNHSGQPEDDRVYINPALTDAEGDAEAEEGCLSLPGLYVPVVRPKAVRMQAVDLAGNRIEQTDNDYIARIWQHEFDHLNGILLTDRMGPVAKLSNRKLLQELEEKYAAANPPAAKPKLLKR